MAGNTGWGHSSPRHLIWGWSANEVALVGVEDAGVLTTVGHLSESHLLSHGARHRWGPHLSLPCRNGPASAHGLSPQCARSRPHHAHGRPLASVAWPGPVRIESHSHPALAG